MFGSKYIILYIGRKVSSFQDLKLGLCISPATLPQISEASSAGEIKHERTTNPSWSWWNAHLQGLLEKT